MSMWVCLEYEVEVVIDEIGKEYGDGYEVGLMLY